MSFESQDLRVVVLFDPTRAVHWIGSEVWEPPRFDGLRDVQGFIEEFEEQIPTKQRIKVLDIALKATPARWWATHKETIKPWEKLKQC